MTAKSRNKGAGGERECIKAIYDLTGIELKRNYSQTAFGGHDLIGLNDWAVEVKRYAVADNASKKIWWRQAVDRQSAWTSNPSSSTEQTANHGAVSCSIRCTQVCMT